MGKKPVKQTRTGTELASGTKESIKKTSTKKSGGSGGKSKASKSAKEAK